MLKPVIAIDIDDVIADGTGALIESVNTRHGVSLTHEDYHSVGGEFWGYYERVWKSHGLEGIVKYDDLSNEMKIDQSHVPLLPGAQFALTELAKRYHIVFITARSVEWKDATRTWLESTVNGFNGELYFAGDHYDANSTSKGKQAKELGATLLIDDNIANCQSAIDEGIDVILFGDYGWQQNAPSDMKRCKDWPELLEYLNEA